MSFDSLLTKYQNDVDTIKGTPLISPETNHTQYVTYPYYSIKGAVYWGSTSGHNPTEYSSISDIFPDGVIPVSSQDECYQACIGDPTCTSAVYNASRSVCYPQQETSEHPLTASNIKYFNGDTSQLQADDYLLLSPQRYNLIGASNGNLSFSSAAERTSTNGRTYYDLPLSDYVGGYSLIGQQSLVDKNTCYDNCVNNPDCDVATFATGPIRRTSPPTGNYCKQLKINSNFKNGDILLYANRSPHAFYPDVETLLTPAQYAIINQPNSFRGEVADASEISNDIQALKTEVANYDVMGNLKEMDTKSDYLVNDNNAGYQALLNSRGNTNDASNKNIGAANQIKDLQTNLYRSSSAYVMWCFAAFLLFIYTAKIIFFPKVVSLLLYRVFWVSFTVLFLVSTSHATTAPGFIVWVFLIIFFSLIQIGVIPPP
jgi:hypothetical protein